LNILNPKNYQFWCSGQINQDIGDQLNEKQLSIKQNSTDQIDEV
jgi:hypothetical protein